jgi:hypothetical protein
MEALKMKARKKSVDPTNLKSNPPKNSRKNFPLLK